MTFWIIFSAFVMFVVLPVLFAFESIKNKKTYEFDEHVADALRVTIPQ